MGELKITLNKALPKALSELNAICDDINNAIENGHRSGTVDMAPWGLASINVMPADGKVINWDSVQASARAATRNHAHAMVNAENINGRPVNLISVTVNTAERDEYLRAIYETMMDASKRQLSKERPGILCIHIPEIKDFAGLADNSALQEMAFAFFAKERNNYVCAVAFSSDTRIIERAGEHQFSVDALAYKNAHCRFPDANKISMFSIDDMHEASEPGRSGFGQTGA